MKISMIVGGGGDCCDSNDLSYLPYRFRDIMDLDPVIYTNPDPGVNT